MGWKGGGGGKGGGRVGGRGEKRGGGEGGKPLAANVNFITFLGSSSQFITLKRTQTRL